MGKRKDAKFGQQESSKHSKKALVDGMALPQFLTLVGAHCSDCVEEYRELGEMVRGQCPKNSDVVDKDKDTASCGRSQYPRLFLSDGSTARLGLLLILGVRVPAAEQPRRSLIGTFMLYVRSICAE